MNIIFLPMDKCRLQFPLRKHLFTEKIAVENHNEAKRKVVEPSPSREIYKTLTHLKFTEHFKRGDRKVLRAEGPGILL